MKMGIIFLVAFFSSHFGEAQKITRPTGYFRAYLDNDAIDITRSGTDLGYTNGLRFDRYNIPKKTPHGIINWFNHWAGKDLITTSGWGLMQLIFAPKKTSIVPPDKNDYSYAGGLVGIYTIHSSNNFKKINAQSELVVGLMGPASFAKEAQVFFHYIINDPLPLGWNYQLPSDLLLNYNLKVEKELSILKGISLIGAGEIFLGSMLDGFSLHFLVRIEKKSTYFSGLTNQYFLENKKKPHLVISFRSTVDHFAYNALLEGGLFNKKSPINDKYSNYSTNLERQKFGGSLELCILTSFRNFSISCSQKTITAEFIGYGSHLVGNLSLYKAL